MRSGSGAYRHECWIVSATGEINPAPYRFCDADLLLLPQGGIVWPDRKTLIVSDLHLEKASSYARRGVFLPPYDTRATLKRLDHLISACQPAKVIALGDSFHESGAEQRLPPDDRDHLSRLVSKVDHWIWVTGNHDPDAPSGFDGEGYGAYRLASLIFRHEPTGERGEIAGHLHPSAKIKRRGLSVRRRCFVSDGKALILPAMGALTGGLDVTDPAFDLSLSRDGRTVWMVSETSVYRIR